ncbi:hypothetical protein LY78DRAFT_683234 [Colletotrichum sublineola]|nr:hypothetical protein LY78DRAFT_683234 [Colletotrichum sublineola]
MTRPKVPEDKRQRTAQACDTCKRRKQKCNGSRPCATCTKRSLVCTYTTSSGSEQTPPDQTASPSKRRNIEELPTANPAVPDGSLASASPAAATTPWESKPQQLVTEENPAVSFDVQPSVEIDHETTAADREFDTRSRHSTASGPDEETSLMQSTRMLQDPTGRLLYVGDSASLAYLQLIRMIVEASVGPSDFTLDPSRHKIMEATIAMPANIRPPHILPDRDTANALIDSFFTNASDPISCQGESEMAAFEKSVETCYSDPLAAQSSFLCLLYLTFAIGTVLGTPLHGSKQDGIFKKLHASEYDRAELFFRSAKALGDPVTGFEDADFWSVQALSLMAIYMLAVSKRNAAYAYFGMAVRSGFALGLHRVQENHFIFKSHEIRLRRNLWRSLFVLDRFLAASLGRPVAIDEQECSTEALLVFEKNAQGELVRVTDPNDGLDAATINLVQKAYESNYLPQRNPFVLYFLFAASLIVLSNEFAAMYPNPSYETSISNTIAIMRYCAASDPQANRLLFILTSFRNVIYELRQKKTEQPAMPAPPTLSPTSTQDPISTIFRSSRVSRKNSFATNTSGQSAASVKAMAPPPPSAKTDHSFSTPTGPHAGQSPAVSTPGMSQGEQSVRMSGDSDTADGELEFDQLWGWSAVPNTTGGSLAGGSAAVPAGAPPALMTAATPPNAPTFPGPGSGQGFQGFPSFIVPGGPNGSGVPAVAAPGYVATPNVPMVKAYWIRSAEDVNLQRSVAIGDVRTIERA